MRIIHLSDHVGDLRRRTERLLQAARRDRDESEQHRFDARIDLAVARTARPLWRRLLLLPTGDERAARARRQLAVQERDRAAAKIAELQIQLGELDRLRPADDLAHQLADALSDDWVLIRGYRNRRGELDHLLIGPGGVWALAERESPLLLDVDGESWRFESLDGTGAVSGGGDAIDVKGRNWGRQVDELTTELVAHLATRRHQLTVRTGVVLSDRASRVVSCRRPGVDLVVVGAGPLLADLAGHDGALTSAEREVIVELVRREHRFQSGLASRPSGRGSDGAATGRRHRRGGRAPDALH